MAKRVYTEEQKARKAESNKRWREANRERARESCKRWREANKTNKDLKARKAEQNKRWYEANKEAHAAQKKVYYDANRDAVLAKNKAWREANPEKVREIDKAHYEANKEAYLARVAARRARKLQATPKYADQEAIREIYRTCPEGYHVDHIIPLKNDRVCGLHIASNLQHLPAAENLSKSNRLDESYL
jgi:hypothetical protein